MLSHREKTSFLFQDEIRDYMTLQGVNRLIHNYEKALKKNLFPDMIGNKKSTNEIISLLKRNQFDIGPYCSITIFEAANRIASDRTLMDGVCLILKQPSWRDATVKLRLGTMHEKGCGDFTVQKDSKRVEGEAFDVAPSFFNSKLISTLKKWKDVNALNFIVFNAEVLNNNKCKQYCDLRLRGWRKLNDKRSAVWIR